MNNEFAYEYVHSQSVGNLEKCREIIKNTDEKLEQLYNIHNIRGYQLLLIKDDTDIEEKLIEPKFEGVTMGKLPFVYSFVQPFNDVKSDFNSLMESLQYKRVDD
ncbi:hypothetical protein NIES4071_34310 [Calothrix sp. NIES-4071]|nr:hypothetical protein NIES4071_34310 [Calothrix sp. NIES-4071]BAZ57750.1 hypothetical protein NIES4105_34240 [Calothrix sp. NIES-4105]